MPPLAASPWQAEHFSENIFAPFAGVPLPGGRLVPSGRTAMSHCLMSASVSGLPRPGDCASAASAPKASARAVAAITLRVDMLDLPFVVHGPARGAVVMLIGERKRCRDRVHGFAPLRHEVGAQRLNIAAVVVGTTKQRCRLAVPAPRHDETREGLFVDRALQRGFAPTLAAVGRDQHFRDAPGARI